MDQRNESCFLADRFQQQGVAERYVSPHLFLKTEAFFLSSPGLNRKTRLSRHRGGAEKVRIVQEEEPTNKRLFKGDWLQARFHQRLTLLFFHSGMLLDVDGPLLGVSYETVATGAGSGLGVYAVQGFQGQ